MIPFVCGQMLTDAGDIMVALLDSLQAFGRGPQVAPHPAIAKRFASDSLAVADWVECTLTEGAAEDDAAAAELPAAKRARTDQGQPAAAA